MRSPWNPSPTPRLRVGQQVHVNAYTCWHAATVTSIAHTSIGITYRSTLPAPYAATVAPHLVRPADGVVLTPAAAIRPGDVVVAADDTCQVVAGCWRGRDRWWVMHFHDGGYTTVPPGAVLRTAAGSHQPPPA